MPVTELEKPKTQYLKAGRITDAKTSALNAETASTRTWRQLLSLLVLMVDREVTATYKRSLLGIAWAIVIPILQLAVLSFTFHSVLGTNIPAYASFTFIGLMVWNWFQSSLVEAAGCVIKNHRLVKQPGFQTDILPAISISMQLIHFVVCVPVLLMLMCFDGIPITATILWLPLLLVLQFLFTLSLSYPLAALNVTFRETKHILAVILNLGLFLTPVFYSSSTFPQHWLILQCNPLTGLLASYRAIILSGHTPDFSSLALMTALTILLLPLGSFLYNSQSRRFVEEL